MAHDDIPPGQEYKGPSGIARNSPWLNNENLPHDRDTVVVIEKVLFRKEIKFQGTRPETNKLSLKFHGSHRELVLNATMKRTLDALFTPNVAEWWGKPIALYVEQDVKRPGGAPGPAVRIRAKRVPMPATKGVTLKEPDPPPANTEDGVAPHEGTV